MGEKIERVQKNHENSKIEVKRNLFLELQGVLTNDKLALPL